MNPASRSAANSPGAVFDRLMGLETEYAIRFPAGPAARPTNLRLFQRLVGQVRRRVPAARTIHFKRGVFLANGGAVWFEVLYRVLNAGLIEGSTPECRSPRRLLVYQRAQDRLLSEAARPEDCGGGFALLKNDCDGQGNYYGAQENYEVTIASGLRLFCWRAGLVLMAPLMAVFAVSLALLISAVLVYLALAGFVYLALWPWESKDRRIARFLFSGEVVGEEHSDVRLHWLSRLDVWATRTAMLPVAAPMFLLTWLVGFWPHRRKLLAFLVSRPILSGSGTIDAEGRFRIAQKARVVNCVLGLNRFWGDRPLLSCGHFVKVLAFNAWFSPSAYFELFRRRQRVQICLGDSNMAEVAEYLRIGTTALVLDALEAGALAGVPRLRRPLRALRRFVDDPTLTAAVDVRGGRKMTAVEIQRAYLDACRRWLDRLGEPAGEAREVLKLWQETLDLLQHDRDELFGSIDWITKKYLLDTAGKDAPINARQKIDLRYHELSAEGYFEQLRQSGTAAQLVSAEEIERAIRTPPPDTPATMRGHHIREHSGTPQRLLADWRRVIVGKGRRRKVFWLTTQPRPQPDEQTPEL